LAALLLMSCKSMSSCGESARCANLEQGRNLIERKVASRLGSRGSRLLSEDPLRLFTTAFQQPDMAGCDVGCAQVEKVGPGLASGVAAEGIKADPEGSEPNGAVGWQWAFSGGLSFLFPGHRQLIEA